MEKEPASDNTHKDYLDQLKQELEEIKTKLTSLYQDITNLVNSSSPYREVVSPLNTAKLTALREQILKLERRKNSADFIVKILERRLRP